MQMEKIIFKYFTSAAAKAKANQAAERTGRKEGKRGIKKTGDRTLVLSLLD